MEGFIAIQGSNHVLEPLGYGAIRKTVKRGSKVLSAADQFEIHQIASMFQSPLFTILPPLELESQRSYTMPYLLDVGYFDLESHGGFFHNEYNRFYEFMMGEGYFPFGSKVLFSQGKLHIIDFSHYGTICTNSKHTDPMLRKVIHMPKMKFVIPFSVLEDYYAIPEKIETDAKTDE